MEQHMITSSQLADSAGIPRPTLSQILNGRNKTNEGAKKVSSDIIRKIHDAFPTLNIMWLMFGDGDMDTNANFVISEPKNNAFSLQFDSQTTDNQEFQNHLDFENEVPNFDSENFEVINSRFKPAEIKSNHQNNQVSNNTVGNSGKNQPKRIQSIMVFYDDNSFEIFKPA